VQSGKWFEEKAEKLHRGEPRAGEDGTIRRGFVGRRGVRMIQVWNLMRACVVMAGVSLMLGSLKLLAQPVALERLAPAVGNLVNASLSGANAVLEMDLRGAVHQLIKSATNRGEMIFLRVPEARCLAGVAPSWQVYLCGIRDAGLAKSATRQSLGWVCSDANSPYYIGELTFASEGAFRKGKTGRGSFALNSFILESIIGSDGKALVTFVSNANGDSEQLAESSVTLTDVHFAVQRVKRSGASVNFEKARPKER
jgi:hypothetical protein